MRPVRRVGRIEPQRDIEFLQSRGEAVCALQHVAMGPVGEERIRVEQVV
jgi:hypothetical protein